MNIASAKCILGDSKNLNLINENISKLENKETTFIYFDLKKGESQNTFDGFIKNGYELVKNGNDKLDIIEIDQIYFLLMELYKYKEVIYSFLFYHFTIHMNVL